MVKTRKNKKYKGGETIQSQVDTPVVSKVVSAEDPEVDPEVDPNLKLAWKYSSPTMYLTNKNLPKLKVSDPKLKVSEGYLDEYITQLFQPTTEQMEELLKKNLIFIKKLKSDKQLIYNSRKNNLTSFLIDVNRRLITRMNLPNNKLINELTNKGFNRIWF